MKKIVALMLVCAMTLGSLTPSTASAGDRLKLRDARDLVQLGIAGVKGAKKVGQGAQTFNDAVSRVQSIGKVFRRR